MAKVLLVDDNELNCDMLSRRLQRKGFEIVVGADGHAALALARSANPDIILMDLELPDLSGTEILRLLKAERRTRLIPVIALTCHASPTSREEALAAGFDDFETKPVDFPRLLERLANALAAMRRPAAGAVGGPQAIDGGADDAGGGSRV